MRLNLYKVFGNSMVPTLACGDFVISWKVASCRYKVGDIVVVRHPRFGHLVKRIQSVDENSSVRLIGDSPLSTSPDNLGWQDHRSILGRVIWRVSAERYSPRL